MPKGDACALSARGGGVPGWSRVEVGPAGELSRRHGEARPINARGRLVTPGWWTATPT